MADLRIVDAPVLLQESITDDVKMPTGGLGNYAIRLGDLVWYVVAKENLASKSYVDTSSKGVQDKVDNHVANKNNPHEVTKVQVGLGNVDNTADIDKPVSNATKSAIITATTDMATKAYVNQKDNLKADKATTLSGYGITDAYTKDETYSKIDIDNTLVLKADVAYVDGKDGDLTTLTTNDKTNLVKAINEVYDNTKGVVSLYDKNVALGAWANGWTDTLVTTSNGRTIRERNSDFVNVFDYFSKEEVEAYKNNNAIDVTAAVQRAINSGKNIDLVGRTFYVNNLTQTTNSQCIISSQGIAKLIKNNNGAILTSTASYGFVMHNINWRGDSSVPTYTGDGVVATGDQPQFINCGGRWISGRALKATGGHVTILGTCDIYQTTDTTANGYDIEIGKNGTSTLYHQLISVYTGQKTGGILLVDTGSHSLHGGQFGKLSIKAGTKPSGVNGGITIGARILGDVTVEQSNATFTSNQFDAVNITFANGTSYCSLDASNIINAAAVIINNGNTSNNLIQRNYGTGADGTFKFAYGDDNNKRVMSYSLSDMTKAYQFDGSVVIPNSQIYKSYASDGTTLYSLLSVSSNNTVQIGAVTGQYTYINGTNVGINSSAGTQVRISDGFIAPFSDNSKFLGTASLRWQHSYIVNAHFFPLSNVVPNANGEVMIELTNDTTLKFKAKGNDGVVRSATLTLA